MKMREPGVPYSNLTGEKTLSKRRRLMAGAALAGLVTAARAIPIDGVARAIPAIDQGNANLCWLAGAAMLVSWQSGKTISMNTLAHALGPEFLWLYQQGLRSSAAGGLPFKLVEPLARAIHADTARLASFDIPWWTERLRNSPMLIFGWDTNATMAHVRILASLSGDTSIGKSMWATLIDPAGGIVKNEPFRDVIAFYEGLPRHVMTNGQPLQEDRYPSTQLLFYTQGNLR
ncbi:hypothetical protein G3O00_05625 [Burkholderia sp. Ac-20384]|nr:hypothetical protein [Burkholderia sp. Ac-20384]